jgi:uncharacterized membrane protein YdbT with pleckstrin-like domain
MFLYADIVVSKFYGVLFQMPMNSKQVVRFKRHWISLFPQFFLAGILLFVGLYVTAHYPDLSVLEFPLSWLGLEVTLVLPVFLLIFLVVVIRPFIQLKDSEFEVSGHHLRITRGRYSLWKHSQEFAFEDLLGVQVRQSLIDRLLGVGGIDIGSKTSSIKIAMNGLKNPKQYADLISRRIDDSRIESKRRH